VKDDLLVVEVVGSIEKMCDDKQQDCSCCQVSMASQLPGLHTSSPKLASGVRLQPAQSKVIKRRSSSHFINNQKVQMMSQRLMPVSIRIFSFYNLQSGVWSQL